MYGLFSLSYSNLIHNQLNEQCYEELVQKFPVSAYLRRDYADFCDCVLNDAKKAENLRKHAELLDTGESFELLRFCNLFYR
jgi:hypothetical protein